MSSADDRPKYFRFSKQTKNYIQMFIAIFGFSMKMHSDEHKQTYSIGTVVLEFAS